MKLTFPKFKALLTAATGPSFIKYRGCCRSLDVESNGDAYVRIGAMRFGISLSQLYSCDKTEDCLFGGYIFTFNEPPVVTVPLDVALKFRS